VHFQRLRLAGFKSFVEPTEFRIEPGLTGIVGPNGCGKSNLLEALRWVMGANSAKAMRAGGMDDVIFAGAANRPGRNHAEVSLTIENSARRAPAAFNDHPVIEVVRRIDRGEGSTYKINGREVRARDVQLLFADASTGSNSPALVRQGQISELIAAKPQNRRLLLEEAAGVSGLHSRRHEAELRLRAAEANLTRLEDVARELEANLGRLKREARQAEKYKKLSAEIRSLQGAVLYAKWAESKTATDRLTAEAQVSVKSVEETARAAAVATTRAADAEAALKPLREAETIAAAVLHKLAIDKDRIDREAEAHAAELSRLTEDLSRIDADQAREAHIQEDAQAALTRLTSDLAALQVQVRDAPERGPELETAVRTAEAHRAAAEAEVERLASEIAAHEAERRAAQARVEDAQVRSSRTRRALDQALQERAAIGVIASPQAAPAKADLALAEQALLAARAALDAAEDQRAEAAMAETATREADRQLNEQLGRLTAEARALAGLVAQSKRGGFSPVLDAVVAERGYERALAAALGDDLDAALDPAAPAYWGGREPQAPVWPPGTTPLVTWVTAPSAMAARLAFVALVDRVDGERLQKQLPPGARLVSKDGDLWRWDGFTARADAPKPAAVRLEQKSRLAEVESEIEDFAPKAATARGAAEMAAVAVRTIEERLRSSRRDGPVLEQRVLQARTLVARYDREMALQEARIVSLDDLIGRFECEFAEHEAQLALARATANVGETLAASGDSLASARAISATAREAADLARSARDQELRDREGRTRRLEILFREHADWTRRGGAAAGRVEQLQGARTKAKAALDAAKDAPNTLESRRLALLDDLSVAEARRTKTSDALTLAEGERSDAERNLRASEAAAAQARELRASLSAHAEAAIERLTEVAAHIREAVRMEPETLAKKLADEAVAIPTHAEGMESHLFNLERQREAIGPVNLRAEEEAGELALRLETMNAERGDLTGAIGRLRQGIDELNSEGRERLTAAFVVINEHFKALFLTLFQGGQAELRLVESDDPLEAGLEIYACPPGKRMATMSLMSGGEQALTAAALIFAVFLAQPAPICVLDEVDSPLDDANVDRFCNLLDEMCRRTETRFIVITHNPVTMARTDRLFGVTMAERGVSQLVSVDLRQAEAMTTQ